MKLIFTKKVWDELEFNRFGFMCVSITSQSCLGGIAVCFLLQLEKPLSFVFLTLVTIVSMLSNSMAIAQLPIKWVVNMFITAVVVTLITLITSLILLS